MPYLSMTIVVVILFARMSEWLKERDLRPRAYASWVRTPLLVSI